MKAVMISIKHKWCELIASGKKTVEVRKTKPRLEVPFKCYIYETKGKHGKGKIIGEFVCEKIDEYYYDYCTHPEIGMDYDCGDNWWEIDDEDLKCACLTEPEFRHYAGNNTVMYGWHISDLKIYDKQKELDKYYAWKKCDSCKKSGYESAACMYDEECKVPAIITKAPQSWCYVEELC